MKIDYNEIYSEDKVYKLEIKELKSLDINEYKKYFNFKGENFEERINTKELFTNSEK